MYLATSTTMLILILTTSGSADGCPRRLVGGCRCRSGEYDLYTCTTQSNGSYSLETKLNEYAKITCENGDFNILSQLSSGLASSNQTLEHFTISHCALEGPGGVSGVLHALGVKGATRLQLVNVHARLGEALTGLEGTGVKILQLDNTPHQTSLPFEVFANVSSLEQVLVCGGTIALSAGHPDNTRLRHLELISAGLRSLPPGALGPLKGLTTLTVSDNKLEELDKGAFDGLDQLQNLYLNLNSLRVCRREVFAGAPRLKTIAARAASLKKVETGAFAGLMDLQKITIERVRPNLTLEPGALAGLPSLQNVSIRRAPLTPLPASLLHGSRALLELTLEDCELVELPQGFLQDQELLRTLNLNGNRLRSLRPDQFWSLKQLRDLDLSDNRLKELPERIFAGLTALQSLHIDRNQLTSIAAETFKGPSALQLLTLSGNKLTLEEYVGNGSTLNGSPFMYLFELTKLDLSGNRIRVIFDDWRETWVHFIRYIDLSYNNIGRLKATDTQFQTNVTVNLSHNQIIHIEIGEYTSDHRGATFILNHNPLRCDCHLHPFLNYTSHHTRPEFIIPAFCATPLELQNISLTTVLSDLSVLTCPLEDCPNNCSCITRPEQSTLDLNCLTAPPKVNYPDPVHHNMVRTKLKLKSAPQTLNLPEHVFSLDLSHLSLTDVPFIPDTVTELDLRSNPIEIVPEWATLKNVRMHLPNNTLKCECRTQDQLRRLNRYNVNDFDDVVCSDGRYLAKIDVDAMCNVIHASIIGGILAALGLFLAITAVVVYRNMKSIKEFIYNMGWTSLIVEEDIDGKTYDVLLSYPDENEKYVVQIIVPALEREGYSVCVRYRDWDVGDFIPDKVAKLVGKSRRTVVLLSDKYFESIACLELRATLLNERAEKWKRAVIVATEDLKPDLNLREFMEKRRYLRLDDELFWSKLRSRLPRKRGERLASGRLKRNVLFTANGVTCSEKKYLCT